MKRNLAALLLLLSVLSWAQTTGVKTLQLTIGASVTQVSTTNIYARQVTFQNNAGHSMRVGDSATTASRGAFLASGGGSWTVAPSPGQALDLSLFWAAGTQNDLLDVIYVQ